MKETILAEHMQEICETLLENESCNAEEVMGWPDDLKLRSAMTLFAAADPENDIYQKVLDKFFEGKPARRHWSCCGSSGIWKWGQLMTRQDLFEWVREEYGSEPEYPWHDRNAVLRREDNGKWYGVVLEVSGDKLGLSEKDFVDVLNGKAIRY